jgi:hypothetical protein
MVINLTPSRSYNYSFYLRMDGDLLRAINLDLTADDNVTERSSYTESSSIIVSAQSVPFYFPVEHSYSIGGNIKELSLMAEQVSRNQTGQYPIIILTDKGIYALEQGSGLVLYSNLTLISNDVCEAGVVQTSNGIVYVANRSVNLLLGRDSISLSSQLEGECEMTIRESNSYRLATDNTLLYSITPFLSAMDFRDYISGKILLLYDSEKKEIIVSNQEQSYSYVFSMEGRVWFKISQRFVYSSERYALVTTVEDRVNVVDITREQMTGTSLTHVQTRPVKLGTDGYKTIYRAILRGKMIPDDGKPFGCYIFASSNLLKWALVCAVQSAEEVVNMRMIRASKSDRFYIVVMGGKVKQNHSIGYIDFMLQDQIETKDR